MNDVFAYGPRYSYPHMAEFDKAIWERFMAKNPDYFDSVQYDLHVGSKPDFSTVVSENTGGDVGNIYQRKIDVVGKKGEITTIVEIKPRADARALGQVTGYETLYRRDIEPGATTKRMIITDQILADMDHVAQEMNVILIAA